MLNIFKTATILVSILTLSINVNLANADQQNITEETKKYLDLLILGKTKELKHTYGEYKKTLFTSNIDGDIVINRDGYVKYNNCYTNNIENNSYYSINKKLYELFQDSPEVLLINSVYKGWGINNVGSIQSDAVSKILNGNIELRIKKECKDNGTTELQYGGNTDNTDILVIPRYLYAYLVQTFSWADLGETHSIVDVITYDDMKEISDAEAVRIKEENKKIKEEEELYTETLNIYKEYSSSQSKEHIGSLFITVNDNGDKKQSVCTLDYKGADAQKVIGYRRFNNDILFRSLKNRFTKNGNYLEGGEVFFERVFKDINSAFLSIKNDDSQCNAFVDYPHNIIKLKNAFDREEKTTMTGKIVNSSDALEKYAVSSGYKSKIELDFASRIGATLNDIKYLRKYNAASIDVYTSYKDEMVKSNYSDKANKLSTVKSFISDRENGLKKGLTAIQERERRVVAFNAARAKKAAADKLAREKFAKQYPFEAILSCGINGEHLNISACFIGSKYGAETELELKNGNIYNMYKSHQITSAGKETRAGLVIPIRKVYEIKAQNSSQDLLLDLKIMDRKTGKVIYQKSASQYGVVRAAAY